MTSLATTVQPPCSPLNIGRTQPGAARSRRPPQKKWKKLCEDCGHAAAQLGLPTVRGFRGQRPRLLAPCSLLWCTPVGAECDRAAWRRSQDGRPSKIRARWCA